MAALERQQPIRRSRARVEAGDPRVERPLAPPMGDPGPLDPDDLGQQPRPVEIAGAIGGGDQFPDLGATVNSTATLSAVTGSCARTTPDS